MDKSEDWVIIARFGRPHGVKGWVSVISHTEPPDNVVQYQDWHMRRHHVWQPIEIEELQVLPKLIIAKITNCDDRDAAALLTNCEIAVSSSALPDLPSDEFYWHQLVGLLVETPAGQILGEVTEIRPTGANDVLVVKGPEKRHLIPYLPSRYILSVDLAQKRIIADWDPDF